MPPASELHVLHEDPLTGRTLAEVRVGGQRIGEVDYAVYPALLFVWSITLDAPNRVELYGQAVSALLELMPVDDPACQYIHSQITDPLQALAYKSSPIAPGATLVGGIGARVSCGEPLLDFPDAFLRQADPASTSLTVMYEPVPPGEPITADGLRTALQDPAMSERRKALRGATFSEGIDVPLRHAAFSWALLDPDAEVRRFAAICMAGCFPTVPYSAPVPMLLEQLRAPLQAIERLGLPPIEAGRPFSAPHAVRNQRFAIQWSLGLMVLRNDADAVAQLSGALEQEVVVFDADRDRALFDAAEAELQPEGYTRGLGVVEIRGVFELCRYTVLRDLLVSACDDAADDKFFWLIDMVRVIIPPPGATSLHRCSPAVTAAIHAPAPGRLKGGALPVEVRRDFGVSGSADPTARS